MKTHPFSITVKGKTLNFIATSEEEFEFIDFHAAIRAAAEVSISAVTTFKDRLLMEKNELNEKRSKLYDFMGSPAFRKIEPVQQSLLPVQFAAMVTYEECLTQRIMWLEKSETKTEPIIASNGIQAEPDEDLNQVTVQGEIHIGDPL